jgi:ATP-dependent exoDNAse (exonuclease V) alpha subunit
MLIDPKNKAFKAALFLIEATNYNVFLTGKAGTGKTTFLRYIRKHVSKKMAIVAPTGVAAVNAGGMTIHSLFHIPPSVYPPNDPRLRLRAEPDRPGVSIRSHFKMSQQKRKLFKELELLVIDEVSMVRCDLLDVIDRLLRTYGGDRYLPFGGKQVLFIGDPFQLPPVTPDDQWEVLGPHYESSYFFSAQAWQAAQPKLLELNKVYRQRDLSFINVLNRIRSGEQSTADLALLNKRWVPADFNYTQAGYIYLGVTNRDVDRRNQRELKALDTPAFTYLGLVAGDFKPADMPTPPELVLKVGAQVMFVKNDIGESRRFFNGKIGKIIKLEEDRITVDCSLQGAEATDPIVVETARWTKIRYEWNAEEREIDEIETGSYEQFPLKLAWAITVHKSQGLTFEQVFANLNGAFAAGQTYVALSRCTQLEGLKLATRLRHGDIKVDPMVKAFADGFADDAEIEALLDRTAFLAHKEEVEEALVNGELALAVPAFYALQKAFPDFKEETEPLEAAILAAIQKLQ